MYIEELERHLQVLAREESLKLIWVDRKFWNIISINGPMEERSEFTAARSVHYACFDDVDETQRLIGNVHARAEDLAGIFEFARSVKKEPLVIQCQLGISRSTAVALALITHQLGDSSGSPALAVDILLRLRPKARPNPLVLELGLATFLETARAEKMASYFLSHPRLAAIRSASR